MQKAKILQHVKRASFITVSIPAPWHRGAETYTKDLLRPLIRVRPVPGYTYSMSNGGIY